VSPRMYNCTTCVAADVPLTPTVPIRGNVSADLDPRRGGRSRGRAARTRHPPTSSSPRLENLMTRSCPSLPCSNDCLGFRLAGYRRKERKDCVGCRRKERRRRTRDSSPFPQASRAAVTRGACSPKHPRTPSSLTCFSPKHRRTPSSLTCSPCRTSRDDPDGSFAEASSDTRPKPASRRDSTASPLSLLIAPTTSGQSSSRMRRPP
jgi:hypothetical protein